ncbi:MAG: DoxX family membrane protein [Actinomycetota bacterium]
MADPGERSLIEGGIPARPPSLIAGGIPCDGGQRGFAALLLLLVRLACGAGTLVLAVRILRGHADLAAAAPDWGLPAPAPLLWAGGGLLVLAGLALVLGLGPRLAALVALLTCLAAVATAGRVDGGLALWLPAAVAVGCLLVVWRGGGGAQLLNRIDP